MSQDVAKTILAQLGGNKFIAMTGAGSFSSGPTALGMCLPRTPLGGFTGLRIELMDSDLYRLVFLKQSGSFTRGTFRVSETVEEDVYCDSLAGAFEAATGLRVSL